ncbi:MAG: hypothetical protein AAF969_06545 [Bacteroidota bacterium]
MRTQKLALCAIITTWALVLFSCGKDDSPKDNPDDGPTETFYNITQASIDDDAYTAPEDLVFLYSIDNGETYDEEKPEDLSKGDELWVKLNNGSDDITEEDFNFDWSDSSIAAADTESDLAKFVVKEADLTISVTVTDKLELLVSNRDTGQFYILDLSDGGLAPAFTFMNNEEPLTRVRSAVYNFNDESIYLSTISFGSIRSKLYSTNLKDLKANVINSNVDENDSEIWQVISDLIITPENLIMATLEIDNPSDTALASFDTAGSQTESISFMGDEIPCCGMGLIYGGDEQELLVGRGISDPVKIFKTNSELTELEAVELTMDGFPDSNAIDYEIWNLVKDNSGIIYALVLQESPFFNTHIAAVDMENKTLKHVAQIGTGQDELYSGLIYLPAYAF